MYCSNSFLLTNFFVPTYSTNGHFGFFNISSILLIPIFEYTAASCFVKFIFNQNGISNLSVTVFSIINHAPIANILLKIIKALHKSVLNVQNNKIYNNRTENFIPAPIIQYSVFHNLDFSIMFQYIFQCMTGGIVYF